MAAKPLKPIFKKFDFDRECWTWGLNKEDFERVQLGYACGRCLEPFNHWVPKCPVCGEEQSPNVDLPREWRKQGE